MSLFTPPLPPHPPAIRRTPASLCWRNTHMRAANLPLTCSLCAHIVPFVLEPSAHPPLFPCHTPPSFGFNSLFSQPSFLPPAPKVFLTYCPEWHFVVNGLCLANDSRGVQRQWRTRRRTHRDTCQTQGQESLALAGAAYFSWKYQGVCLRGLLTDSSNSGTLPSI